MAGWRFDIIIQERIASPTLFTSSLMREQVKCEMFRIVLDCERHQLLSIDLPTWVSWNMVQRTIRYIPTWVFLMSVHTHIRVCKLRCLELGANSRWVMQKFTIFMCCVVLYSKSGNFASGKVVKLVTLVHVAVGSYLGLNEETKNDLEQTCLPTTSLWNTSWGDCVVKS